MRMKRNPDWRQSARRTRLKLNVRSRLIQRVVSVHCEHAMKGLFRELLTEVKRVNPSSAALLRPGLSRELIEKKLARLPWEISPDAVSLYEWADGANAPFEVLPSAYFIPLDEALRQFKAFDKVAQQIDEEDEPYRENFRFLSDWSDGGYAFGRLD